MVKQFEMYLDSELVDAIEADLEASFDNGDFSSDEWIEGKSMESEYLI